MTLSTAGEKLRDEPNAGGNSVLSEVMSFEMMRTCFGATLLKTEMEVNYFPEGGSITDYMCEMFGLPLGVSVTRAMKYRGDYVEDDAVKLLNKKLKGVIQSSRNTLEKWSKQILHVWTTSAHVTNVIMKVYNTLPESVRSNTVVLVTTAPQSDFIFKNK